MSHPNYVNPHRAGWNVHSADMRELLGLDRKAKLPAEGMPQREINGIQTWVNPLVSEATRRDLGWPTRMHRVRCHCSDCGQEMSAGRLFQHKCKI